MLKSKIAIILFFVLTQTAPLLAQSCSRYQKIFDDILLKADIPRGKVVLVCNPTEDEESFVLQTNKPSEIIIGLDKISHYPDIVYCGVISHELGHFLLNHTGEPIFANENLADSICGSIMRKLGFDIDDMSNVITYFRFERARYGTSQQRIDAYKKGWLIQNKVDGAAIYQAYTPKITWEVLRTDSLLIKIGSRQMILDTFYNHGLVFDSLTNSTIQLMEWDSQIGSSGIGRIVTNRSLYTYRKTKMGYNLYYKGEERKLVDCLKGYLTYDGNDGITPECKNEVWIYKIQYTLTDYKLAPLYYCMPATIFITQ